MLPSASQHTTQKISLIDRRGRPKPAVHSLDQMTFRHADSGHSFQVQQSHGSECRFTVAFQTRCQAVLKVAV
jgi:hypothetical protein